MASPLELITAYIKYRDYTAAKQKALDDELKPYADAMATISTAMLDHLNMSGADSIKTDAGTAYVSELDSMKVGDRDALGAFILETGELQLLSMAVAKDAVRDYMAEHQGQLPPGVEKSSIRKVNFRRS
jgi:hypothetical protein